MHGTTQQPHSLVLRYARLRPEAGRNGKTGVTGGTRPPDQGRGFRVPTPHRYVAACRAAWIPELAAELSARRAVSRSCAQALRRDVIATSPIQYARHPRQPNPLWLGGMLGRPRGE